MRRSPILHPVSAVYGAAVRARLSAYSRGLLSPSSLGVPTVSVGNITAGGTGKTPFVEWLCRKLAEQGRRVGVLTRGYQRDSPQKRVLVSDGVSLFADVGQAGDEAFLLAKNLLGVAAIISDSDRTAAGQWAVKELGLNAFVLDDGYQHLQLTRDLNVLLVDATDPWGGKRLLPYGRLREPVSGVGRSDCVVITRADEPSAVQSLVNEIGDLNRGRPVLTSRMHVRAVLPLTENQIGAISPPNPIAAFCGVGNPTAFFAQLRRNGYNVVLTRSFPDHHRYHQRDIDAVAEAAMKHRARSFITTAKDAVKLRQFAFRIPCYVLEIEVQIDQELRFLELLRAVLTTTGTR